MPFELSLIDLVSPYVLQGDTFGAWHAVLSILRVAEHEIAADENGVTIRGTVEFEGNLSLDPTNMSIAAANAENHPQNDSSRRDPWIDIRDAKLDFQLVVPRVASQKVSTAVAAIGNAANFANSAAVITAYDTNSERCAAIRLSHHRFHARPAADHRRAAPTVPARRQAANQTANSSLIRRTSR